MIEILFGIIALLGVTLVFLLIVLWNKRDIAKSPPDEPTKSPPDEPATSTAEVYDDLIQEKKNLIALLEKEQEELQEKIKKLSQNREKYKDFIQNSESQLEELEHRINTLKKEVEIKEKQIVVKRNELDLLISSIQGIIDEQKRKAMEDSFYKLSIPQTSIRRIEDIQEVAKRFPEIEGAIKTAIYSYYYAAEVSGLCNRVLGEGRKPSGIYKITNSITGLVYVGKSVDIRNRWTQHIRRAVGIEKETQNLLYPAMREFGIWNFSFEVLELCEKDILNEREKFYQSVYKAKEDYSIR